MFEIEYYWYMYKYVSIYKIDLSWLIIFSYSVVNFEIHFDKLISILARRTNW